MVLGTYLAFISTKEREETIISICEIYILSRSSWTGQVSQEGLRHANVLLALFFSKDLLLIKNKIKKQSEAVTVICSESLLCEKRKERETSSCNLCTETEKNQNTPVM